MAGSFKKIIIFIFKKLKIRNKFNSFFSIYFMIDKAIARMLIILVIPIIISIYLKT